MCRSMCMCVAICVCVYVCVAMCACVCVSLCPFLGVQGHPYMISLWEHKYLWRVLAVLYFIAFLLASELVRGGPLPLPRRTHTTMASAQPDARTHTTTTGAQGDARTQSRRTHTTTTGAQADARTQPRRTHTLMTRALVTCSSAMRVHQCVVFFRMAASVCVHLCVCPCVFGGGLCGRPEAWSLHMRVPVLGSTPWDCCP